MQNPTTKLYAAYGSNLNIGQMAYRCQTAKVVGSDVLENYRLLFRGYSGNAVATIEPMEGFRVPVLIWKVTEHDEASLDAYEGFPTLYRKEVLGIRLGGSTREAFVYIMNNTDPDGWARSLARPSVFYFNTIMEGYESAINKGMFEFDTGILHDARDFSSKGSWSGMSNEVLDQILRIRASGEVNMIDTRSVQLIAMREGFYELVAFIEDHRPAYSRFIITSRAGDL